MYKTLGDLTRNYAKRVEQKLVTDVVDTRYYENAENFEQFKDDLENFDEAVNNNDDNALFSSISNLYMLSKRYKLPSTHLSELMNTDLIDLAFDLMSNHPDNFSYVGNGLKLIYLLTYGSTLYHHAILDHGFIDFILSFVGVEIVDFNVIQSQENLIEMIIRIFTNFLFEPSTQYIANQHIFDVLNTWNNQLISPEQTVALYFFCRVYVSKCKPHPNSFPIICNMISFNLFRRDLDVINEISLLLERMLSYDMVDPNYFKAFRFGRFLVENSKKKNEISPRDIEKRNVIINSCILGIGNFVDKHPDLAPVMIDDLNISILIAPYDETNEDVKVCIIYTLTKILKNHKDFGENEVLLSFLQHFLHHYSDAEFKVKGLFVCLLPMLIKRIGFACLEQQSVEEVLQIFGDFIDGSSDKESIANFLDLLLMLGSVDNCQIFVELVDTCLSTVIKSLEEECDKEYVEQQMRKILEVGPLFGLNRQ